MNEKRSYYEKAYRRVRLARYGVLLFFILFLIFSMTFFREEITFDNFRYLMKYLEVSPPEKDGTENLFSFSGNGTAVGMLNGKPFSVSDGTVTSYDLSGRKLMTESFHYQNPTAVANGRYLLLYDIDGTGISVYNSFSELYSKNLPTAIESAYLSDDGGFAVVTREKSYAGGFAVYNNRYKKIYSFMTRTAAVTDVCYDGSGNRAACASPDAQNGDFYTEILTFDLNQDDDIKAKATLVGEMPLSMFCAGEHFALMTDRGVHFYDYDANETAFCDFAYETPQAFYRFADSFAVVLKSSLAGTDTALRYYDFSGSLLYSEYYDSDIASVYAADGYLYVLQPHSVHILTRDENGVSLRETVPTDGDVRAVFPVDGEEYLLISSGHVSLRRLSADENAADAAPDGNADAADVTDTADSVILANSANSANSASSASSASS